MEEGGSEIERLPVDLLAHIFTLLASFKDFAQASAVCWKWKKAARRSLARRERLSFAGYRMDDESTARLVSCAYSLRELDISRSCWGSQITDNGLYKISQAKCISKLTSISLWGMSGITDDGVIELVTKARSLRHLNVGGTFITDGSLTAIAANCPRLKAIVLWCCRHVTEEGLVKVVRGCRELQSVNVWGVRLPTHCFVALLAISPALQIKPVSLHLALHSTSLSVA